MASTTWCQYSSSRPGSGWTDCRRGAATPGLFGVLDELHHDFRAVDLHRIWHGYAIFVRHAQVRPFGVGPAGGLHLTAVAAAVLQCPGVAGTTHRPALRVAGGPVEEALVGGTVALGRQQCAPRFGGTLNEENVRLLAGFQDAQVGVDGGGILNDELGVRLGTAHELFQVRPRGPALVLGEGIVQDVPVG